MPCLLVFHGIRSLNENFHFRSFLDKIKTKLQGTLWLTFLKIRNRRLVVILIYIYIYSQGIEYEVA